MQEKQSINVAACPVTASHEATACVPVSISPFADACTVDVECCGSPVIHSGDESCCGTLNGSCEFTVSQKMRINIPIAFGADIIVGGTYVQNGQTSGITDGECCNCNCFELEDELEILE